jgi:pimeloyl-ACP methyl ester carboxylesterase
MFQTMDIRFLSSDGLELAGELVLPDAFAASNACAVLQQGSTLCDRDGNTPRTNQPSTLYRRIARMLAERGVASFRYDKREWDVMRPRELTFDQRVEDLCAAFGSLRDVDELDGVGLSLVGHSEGGLVVQAAAVELAARGHGPESVAVLASPSTTLLESIEWRADQALARGTAKLRRVGLAIHATLHEYRRRIESGRDFAPGEFTAFADWYAHAGAMNGWESWPWLKQHGQLEVARLAQSLPCRAVYLHGDHDRLVNPESLGAYREITAGNSHPVVCEMMPGLGHYLEDSTRKAFVVSEALVDRVAAWLVEGR